MKSLVVILLSFLSYGLVSSCTLPSDLDGYWESPTKGNLSINSTHILNYDVFTYTGLVFECHLTDGEQYVIKSNNFTVLGGNIVYAALCLTFTKQSSNKYTYFILTSELPDADYERVLFVPSDNTVTLAEVCNNSSVSSTPQETKLLVKSGMASSEAELCASSILGTYWYFNHTTCNESYWDACSPNTEMYFNYSMCSDVQAYSATGVVFCLYQTEISSDTYLQYVYNNDTTVDGSTTYRFTCIVAEKSSDGYVYVSQNPEDCYKNQSGLYSPSGNYIQLSANVTCVPSSSSEETTSVNTAMVAGLVILFLVIIAVGALAGFFVYKKKFKKVEPDEKRVIDRESTNVSADNRTKDAVTPSVVHTEVTSPRTTHGRRKIKKIAIKKVPRRPPSVPPADTKPPDTYRRQPRLFSRESSLITPRTTNNNKSVSSRKIRTEENATLSFTRTDIDAPKVKTAPPELQFSLAREETLTALSRASTIYEDKIGITLLPETPVNNSHKSEFTSFNIETNMKYIKRKSVSLSEKSVKKSSPTKRSKKRRSSVMFKDSSAIYKKKIELVGKVKRKKETTTLDDITGHSLSVSEQPKKLSKTVSFQEAMFGLDMVKELQRPNKALEIKSPSKKESMYVQNNKRCEETISPVGLNDGDDNFFMCSDTNDNSIVEDKGLSIHDASTKELSFDISNLPLTVKGPSEESNTTKAKPVKKISNIDQMIKRVESVAKLSVVRSKTKHTSTNENIKSKKEAVIEQKVLTKIYYNYDFKTKTKIKQRRRRNKLTVNLSKVSSLKRLPTLVNWVECSDLLKTPAMKMQTKLHDGSIDRDMPANNQKSERYTPDTTLKIIKSKQVTTQVINVESKKNDYKNESIAIVLKSGVKYTDEAITDVKHAVNADSDIKTNRFTYIANKKDENRAQKEDYENKPTVRSMESKFLEEKTTTDAPFIKIKDQIKSEDNVNINTKFFKWPNQVNGGNSFLKLFQVNSTDDKIKTKNPMLKVQNKDKGVNRNIVVANQRYQGPIIAFDTDEY